MSSRLEDLLATQLRAAGLPTPEREHLFCDGRQWRFDFAWPTWLIAIEVQGGTWTRGKHARGIGIQQDADKLSEAAVRGWRVLPVTGDMVRSGSACALVTRALAQAVEGTHDNREEETA